MADEDDLPEQLRIRREKRAGILKRGAQAYPVSVPRTTSLLAIRQKHKDLPIDVSTGIIESVTGRVIFKRENYVLQTYVKVMALSYKLCFH
jgi:lysyl-tRNA synthetase class 2